MTVELPVLNVLIAHESLETVQTLVQSVCELGHQVVTVCHTAQELIQRSLDLEADFIITGVDFPDWDGISALVEISKEAAIPAIVVTRQRSLEQVERALQDHVMAYLIEPVQPDDIKPAIYLGLKRFEEVQELRKELNILKKTVEDRQSIERAKAILMRHGDINEADAYKRLRRVATDHRIRMLEAAQRVLAAEEIREQQEKPGTVAR